MDEICLSVIPAEAGIQEPVFWTPTCEGVAMLL